MTETNRIEYKRELTSELDIEKEVVAFLNYKEGGYNYIGIDKDGSTVGVSDAELVESLGFGIPRILRAYGEDCFKFTDNFIRITLPISAHDHAHDHASVQVGEQVKMLINSIGGKELSVDEILKVYKLLYKQAYKSKWYLKKHTIQPALLEGYVKMIYPDKPNHPKQKYRLTAKGIALKDALKNNE